MLIYLAHSETIDLAEDRDRFREMMDKLGIPMPEAGMAVNVSEALDIAQKIGYPVMVRPSYAWRQRHGDSS